jgi:hypothetical protein
MFYRSRKASIYRVLSNQSGSVARSISIHGGVLHAEVMPISRNNKLVVNSHVKSSSYVGDLSTRELCYKSLISKRDNNRHSYFLLSTFSDLTIHNRDQEFKVHQLVICGLSEYFSRLY